MVCQTFFVMSIWYLVHGKSQRFIHWNMDRTSYFQILDLYDKDGEKMFAFVQVRCSNQAGVVAGWVGCSSVEIGCSLHLWVHCPWLCLGVRQAHWWTDGHWRHGYRSGTNSRYRTKVTFRHERGWKLSTELNSRSSCLRPLWKASRSKLFEFISFND